MLWLGNPQGESVFEETGDNVVWLKEKAVLNQMLSGSGIRGLRDGGSMFTT
jgi:hypothetical protein